MSVQPRSSCIPTQISEVYDELKNEIVWLHGRWLTYRELFGEGPRRIELLNEVAAHFFYIIQDVLIDEVQVSLSKLTDPATSGRDRHNLSLKQLQLRLDTHADAGLAARCKVVLTQIELQCDPLRVRRNRKLAHLDLHTSLKQHHDPLPGVSRRMIENALAAVREYMNLIEAHFYDSEYGYEYFVLNQGAGALLTTMRNGLRYHELLRERLIPWDDCRRGRWHDA